METFTETIQALDRQRIRIRWMFALHMALYAAALGLLFVSQPLGMILGIANVAYYLLWLRRQMKAYESNMARACVIYGLCEPWQDVDYTGDHSLTAQDLRELQILPLHKTKNALLSLHSFSAVAGALQMKGSEVTLHYPAQVGGRKSYKFLSGTLLTAQHPANRSAGDWLLLTNGLLDAQAQQDFLARCGYSPVDCTVQKFAVYSHLPDAQLPAAAVRRAENLIQSCPTVAAMRLWQSGVTIYLKGRFYTGRYRPNIAPNETLLRQNGLPERDKVMEFFRFWSQFEA